MANIVLSTPGAERRGAVDNRVERAEDQPAFAAAQGFAQVGQAANAFGRAEERLKKEKENQERRSQYLTAKRDAAQIQADLSVWLKKQEASGKSLDNLGADFAKKKNEEFEKAMSKNDNAFYREYMEEAGVSVFAGLIGQAENARINGEFLRQQKKIEEIVAAKNTVVMNDPSMWKSAAGEIENDINAAILPAETKAKMIQRARHNFAYTSALTDLQTDPAKLKRELEKGDYEGAFSAEEQFNYLSGAENNIFKAMLEGDTAEAEKFIRENKGYFTTIPESEALNKINAVRARREKDALEQDRVNRALYELNFWNDPSWGKLEAYDFRGDETKREKWEERLRQVPNPGARTVYESVEDISSAIDVLAAMPDETKEDRAKIIEKASDLTAAIGSMNAKGVLTVEDMRKYTSSVGKIAVDATLRKDLQAMKLQRSQFDAALKEAKSIKNRKERIKARKAIHKSETNAFFGLTGEADKILADGYANFIKEVAAGNTDAANLIYKDTLIAARNVVYPFLADKKKGDVVTDDNGTVYVYEGMDGFTPVVQWGK